MGLDATEYNKKLTLSWHHEEMGGRANKKCEIHPSNEPILIEDLKTGSRKEIKIFQRAFPTLFCPALNLTQTVSLGELIPGFATVPESERRFTLALSIKRIFKGPLPKVSHIQIPDIWIGKHHIQLPLLKLKRYKKSGSGWWYVPADNELIQKTRPAGSSLGGGSLAFKPADVLYEKKSIVRIWVSFRGDPFTYSNNGDKNNKQSDIYGQIFVEVFGDNPVRLKERHATWSIPNDDSPKIINFEKLKWQLRRFTTTNLNERVDHLLGFFETDNKYVSGKTHDDLHRKFVIEIPDYHPYRFKVTLPQVQLKVLMPSADPNGYDWKIPPIEFKRR